MGGPGFNFGGSSNKQMFEYRNLDWIEDTLTINEWYTPLATTDNVKAFYLIVEQTNNGAADETLELELTINDVVYSRAVAARVSGTQYYITLDTNSDIGFATVNQILSRDADQSAPLETRSLQIRVRQTSAVDVTSAQIEVNMVYATLESTT